MRHARVAIRFDACGLSSSRERRLSHVWQLPEEVDHESSVKDKYQGGFEHREKDRVSSLANLCSRGISVGMEERWHGRAMESMNAQKWLIGRFVKWLGNEVRGTSWTIRIPESLA